MTKPIARDPMYRKRVFDVDIIELCVRWYITYRLSYRDLVEMMAERGVKVAHSTILRWVTRYVPEFEKRWIRFSKAVGTSWRVDETYISIKAKWHYLYRAVDKHGKSVDFLLRRDRGITAAQAFFRKALASNLPRVPRKVTLDGHVPVRRALWLLRREHPCWRNVKVRTNKYLNNLIEQDHRAIKRRCASMASPNHVHRPTAASASEIPRTTDSGFVELAGLKLPMLTKINPTAESESGSIMSPHRTVC